MPANSVNSIAPIILAAGDSTRMGYPKALLPLGNDLFISRILKTARGSGLSEATVVLGRTASIIKPYIEDSGVKILVNPDPGRGQLSSIQIALTGLAPDITAALIWPVDIPAVSMELVRCLTDLFISSGSLISFPVCGDRRGHPAIFHRSLFREFMDAPLEEGPKKILLRHKQEMSMLAVEESATFKDIDTPSDYEELTGETLDSALARRRA
jgi:molybdenum cofactor cytidylyltransferase